MNFINNKLDNLIKEYHRHGLIKFGDFTLKSGKKSNIYLDLRTLISYPELMKDTVQLIFTKLFDIKADYEKSAMMGIPYSGLVLASNLQAYFRAPLFYKRKTQKAYGTKQMFEGINRGKMAEDIFIIDDVLTTGSSILETIQSFLQNDSDIYPKLRGIVVIVDRRDKDERGDLSFSYMNNLNIAVTIKIPVYSVCNLDQINLFLSKEKA